MELFGQIFVSVSAQKKYNNIILNYNVALKEKEGEAGNVLEGFFRALALTFQRLLTVSNSSSETVG